MKYKEKISTTEPKFCDK